jgi:hypothetical protein
MAAGVSKRGVDPAQTDDAAIDKLDPKIGQLVVERGVLKRAWDHWARIAGRCALKETIRRSAFGGNARSCRWHVQICITLQKERVLRTFGSWNWSKSSSWKQHDNPDGQRHPVLWAATQPQHALFPANAVWHDLRLKRYRASPNHPWTNGQVERMNRTIKDKTVKRYHYDSHDQLRCHLSDFLDADNYACRLKTLSGLTPY